MIAKSLFLRLLTALLLALAGTAPAAAQATHIAAELVPERARAAAGSTVLLAVAMRPDTGWHGYWENGGDAGFAMRFAWSLPAGAKLGDVAYPVPETLLISGLMNHVYESDYALLVPLTLPRDLAPGQRLIVSAEADWLACTDTICVPERGRLETSLVVGAPAPRDTRFDAWQRRLPAPLPQAAPFAAGSERMRIAVPLPASLEIGAPHFFARTEQAIDYAAPQRFARKGDWLLIDLARPSRAEASPTRLDGVLRYGGGDGLTIRALPGAVPAGGTPLPETADAAARTGIAALAAILGGAFLGGLLLNVMPCVFPILSLKALSLAQARVDRGKARLDAIAYTAGAVLACAALGGVMLALRAAGEEVGWAFQLQEPMVVAALLLLAVAIAANLAGLFEVPSLWTGTGERSAFATGLLAAFVATPCTGPFMGAAMGAALVLPSALALGVFTFLGLGLAAPFLALGFVPALRRALPRPGPWLGTFRRAMAVPMALTAAALVWLAWRLGGSGFALACMAAAAILIVILAFAGRTQRAGRAAAARVAPALAALLVLGAVTLPRAVAAPQAGTEADILGAKSFSAASLRRAQANCKPVFVYFTADWCLTCKVNEASAIEREGTRDALSKAGVTVLRGDWTRRDPAITRFLAAHGAAGVPLYLWYAPDNPTPEVLPQVLTPAMLAERAAQS
jgi:DsbC/DsbD-like thiol-disulfide interchange protein/cytochrome c biogenesis protein CcdA